jgi:enoyl-CoA hydratase/carnithine racemase
MIKLLRLPPRRSTAHRDNTWILPVAPKWCHVRAEIESFTFQLAGQIAETSPGCIALLKEELRILLESRPMSAETFERLQGLQRQIYDGHDYQEGIRSFLEERKPVFTGD